MRCIVYKSLRQFDYYLFVRKQDALARVPDSLQWLLGRMEQVVELELNTGRALAQADVGEVMQQIGEQGYYLQMPSRTGATRPDA